MQSKRRNVGGSKKTAFGAKEKKRLIQLSLCVCLFLVILLGRGNEVIENREGRDTLLHIIRSDTDFVNAFSTLGESISRGDSILGGLEVLALELFGTGADKMDVAVPVQVYDGPASMNAVQRLSSGTTQESMIRFLRDTNAPEAFETESETDIVTDTVPEENLDQSTQQEISENDSIGVEFPEVPIVPEIPVYTGPTLPENATMEYYDLGLGETVTPVLGEITSAYGYRVHPLTEEYTFHAGVDIAADTGTPIGAFADGTVDFIGESSKYGQYIQLDHGNGMKSFYCHCSELLLGKGKTVTAGQTIALAGDTGDATGSHLHLELKKDDVLLNPSYYIETLS